MAFKHTLSFVLNHPINKKNRLKAITRFFSWQLISKLIKYPIIYPFGEKSNILVYKGLAGATGNIYSGLHEFEDMAFTLHFLRENDLFIDIGANIGSYTILASSEKGANSISIEPIPSTFKILKKNIFINEIEENIRLLNIGLGEQSGRLHFTNNEDATNHVVYDQLNDKSVEIEVQPLDHIIDKNSNPSLIKIDVEGFELQVLKGGLNTLKDPDLHAIIIETNGFGSRYGFKDDDISKLLSDNGFRPYSYNPITRELLESKSKSSQNTIFIKNIDVVKERVESSKKFKIYGFSF